MSLSTLGQYFQHVGISWDGTQDHRGEIQELRPKFLLTPNILMCNKKHITNKILFNYSLHMLKQWKDKIRIIKITDEGKKCCKAVN